MSDEEEDEIKTIYFIYLFHSSHVCLTNCVRWRRRWNENDLFVSFNVVHLWMCLMTFSFIFIDVINVFSSVVKFVMKVCSSVFQWLPIKWMLSMNTMLEFGMNDWIWMIDMNEWLSMIDVNDMLSMIAYQMNVINDWYQWLMLMITYQSDWC